MCIHQKLCLGHKQWDIHPMLGRGGRSQDKDLKFIAACPIRLPQLPNLASLVHILGQSAHPEMVNQRPLLSLFGHTPHNYCALTGLTKPWPIMQTHATGLSSTVAVVEVVALVTKYYGRQLIVLVALYTWPVIQWQCGPSRQASFMPTKGPPQTKGIISDQIGHSRGLVW